MKMHFSRFGYSTMCGRHLSGTQWLTRVWAEVTCKVCRSTEKR